MGNLKDNNSSIGATIVCVFSKRGVNENWKIWDSQCRSIIQEIGLWRKKGKYGHF